MHRFQSTRPRGARRVVPPGDHRIMRFQSTRPRGARRTSSDRRHDSASFNPRARAGRDDQAVHHRHAQVGVVSIHAPARGATVRSRLRHGRTMFQSTRPRGARPDGKRLPDTRLVSIHAPARGATSPVRTPMMRSVFQSTRPRGARRASVCGQGPHWSSFNPRARAGRDAARRYSTIAASCFNPRARAGRDASLASSGDASHCFNPRARAGRDTTTHLQVVVQEMFQSTRPRGARRVMAWTIEASDRVSIHAPARGATCGCDGP